MQTNANTVQTRLLGIADAARYLGISEPTLKRHVRDGVLPSMKLGRLRKFDRVALDHWIESGGKSHAA